jgi:hypothetical protein
MTKDIFGLQTSIYNKNAVPVKMNIPHRFQLYKEVEPAANYSANQVEALSSATCVTLVHEHLNRW